MIYICIYYVYVYFFLVMKMIVCMAMSKNTILELAFCVMSRNALSNISLNSMMLPSLMNGAKRDANCSSFTVI